MRTILLSLAGLSVLAASSPSASAGQDTPPTAPPAATDAPPPMDVRGEHESVWGYLSVKYDSDSNGRIERSEYDRGDEAFERLDSNRDGALSEEDFPSGADRRRRTREDEGPAPDQGRGGERRRERGDAQTAGPRLGEEAPDFSLRPADGGDPVALSTFRTRNLPVALIFGSFT